MIEQLEKLKVEVRRELARQPISPEERAAIHNSGGKVLLAPTLVERFRRDPELLVRAARLVPELKDGWPKLQAALKGASSVRVELERQGAAHQLEIAPE